MSAEATRAQAGGDGNRPSPRADLVSALAWLGFGLAVVWGAWTMDRLESQHINPWTVPGLVPGLLGCGIVLMGALLLARSIRTGALAAGAAFRLGGAGNWSRVGLAALLCILYAGFLLGRDLPFWATSALFVFLFAFLFDRARRHAAGESWRGAAVALAVAAGAGAAITFVFQEIFLVRLP